MMGAGLRMGGRWWFWAVASPGGGRCWSIGAPVLAVLVASGDVGASPRDSWRRVPLVLLIMGLVDVMVLFMLMVLPKVGALSLVMLAVRMLSVMLRVMPMPRVLQVMLWFTVSLVMLMVRVV